MNILEGKGCLLAAGQWETGENKPTDGKCPKPVWVLGTKTAVDL